MKSSLGKTFAGRSLYALLISALVTITAFGQHLVITGAPTLNGTGTYNVKGNITNTVPTTFTETVTVTMNGAAAQSIGTTGNGAIIFPTLNIMPTAGATTTLNVASTVSTAVTIGTGAIATTLAIGANNLTITGTSAFGNGTSALTTAAGSTVTFNSGVAGQVVLGGFTYNGNLTLSGGTKTLNAATLTSVGVAFDASTAGLLTISGGGLTLGTTGSFAATSISSGTITGGSGLAAFNGLLTKTGTGHLTSGSGNLSLLAGLTNTAGNITLAAAQSMSISGGQFAYAAGTLTFPATSTVTYGASAITIVPSIYGNLTLNTDTKTFPAGVTNVATSLDANSNVIITGTLAMNTAGANATIGGDFTNNGTFTAASGAGIVTFDGAAQAIAGSATTFRNLTLGGAGAKTANASINISTGGQLAVNQPLTMSGANVLTMLSGANQPSFTGQTEITGSMAWQANAAQAYTYHNSATSVTFAILDAARTFTLNSAPGTYPNGQSVGHTVNRSFTASYTGWATGTLAMQLGYLQAEAATVPAVTESKLKDFQNGDITSANKVPGLPSGRVTSGAGTFGSVTYSGLTNAQLLPALNNALALDDRFNMFNSIANTAWDVTTTWDAGAVPSSSDDVNIINTHTVTIPDGLTADALSVTIDGTTANALTVGAGASGILNVGVGGLTNNATLGVLTVSNGANVNITGGSLTTGGNITNNGTVTVQ